MLETKVKDRAWVWPNTHKTLGSVPALEGASEEQIFIQTDLKVATHLILKSGQ